MKSPVQLLFGACVTMLVAAALPEGATAAEDEAQVQDLVQVRATSWVLDAHWARRPDSYVLRVMVGPSRPASTSTNAAPAPTAGNAGAGPVQDREPFFIGNVIANLRGLDPVFCGRTLTLVDGRRSISGQPAPTPPVPLSVNQPWPPRMKEGRVEVWLLKADGTQVLPTTYSCDKGPRPTPAESPPVEVTYEFPLAGGEQAVAAAIRIGDNYYIEKLQPSAPKPVAL